MDEEKLAEKKPTRDEQCVVTYEEALEQVCGRYEGLKSDILRSLETPQLGPHHNEGKTMDSHIKLIMSTLEAIRNEEFPGLESEPELTTALREVAIAVDGNDSKHALVRPEIIDYAFLHDISKPECLLLTFEDEKDKMEITLDMWQANVQANADDTYMYDGKQVKSIGYYHPSEKEKGRHGEKAVNDKFQGSNVPPDIQCAIGGHELAVNWSTTAAKKYEEKFIATGLTEKQQLLIFLASYIDTMASLNQFGSPDLSNFKKMVQARKNYLLITENSAGLTEQQIGMLKNRDAVTIEDIEKLRPRPIDAQKAVDRLREEGLLADSTKEEEVRTALVGGDMKILGRLFGKEMGKVRSILVECDKVEP
jgi:hypothetical protein